MLLVASVRAEPDADPDPEPLLYQQYVPSWAAQHFGTPEEVAAEAALFASQRLDGKPPFPGFGFLPARAPPSPLIAIRDVKAPTPAIEALRKPAVQVLRHPSYIVVPPALFFHTIHIRVPDSTQEEAIPIPVAAPTALSFASQHTAQLPYINRQTAGSSLLGVIPVPFAAHSYPFVREPEQAPEETVSTTEEEEEEEEPNYVIIPHFPTELPGIMSLRGVDNEPAAPAGIAQATQPTFTRVVFRNDKAHPSLLNIIPATDGAVISV